MVTHRLPSCLQRRRRQRRRQELAGKSQAGNLPARRCLHFGARLCLAPVLAAAELSQLSARRSAPPQAVSRAVCAAQSRDEHTKAGDESWNRTARRRGCHNFAPQHTASARRQVGGAAGSHPCTACAVRGVFWGL